MASAIAVRPPRVVIDTNVLISALLFRGATLTKLRELWQSGAIVPVVSRATAEEFIAVLRYPTFQLDAREQSDVLAAYLPYCETHVIKSPTCALPKCRDADDQIYLELAASAQAHYLITGDKDLLALASTVKFPVVTPASFVEMVLGA